MSGVVGAWTGAALSRRANRQANEDAERERLKERLLEAYVAWVLAAQKVQALLITRGAGSDDERRTASQDLRDATMRLGIFEGVAELRDSSVAMMQELLDAVAGRAALGADISERIGTLVYSAAKRHALRAFWMGHFAVPKNAPTLPASAESGTPKLPPGK